MLRDTNNVAVTLREIEYSIRIRDKNTSFVDLRDILRSELTKFTVAEHFIDNENPIREFLQSNIERSLIVKDDTRIYFLGYSETDGSLKIDFTLLIVANSANYAPIRKSLDSLVKDTIAQYFEEILERHMPVNISVQANDKEVTTLSDTEGSQGKKPRQLRDTFTRIAAIAALVISLGVGGMYAYNMISANMQRETTKLREEYIDLMIQKKIIEAVKSQEFTVNLYKIADTAGMAGNSSVPVRNK